MEKVTVKVEVHKSSSCSLANEVILEGDGESGVRRLESENDIPGTEFSNTAGWLVNEGERIDDVSMKFLQLKEDSIPSQVVVENESDPSTLDADADGHATQFNALLAGTSKVDTIVKQDKLDKILTPSWQHEFLHLTKEILSSLEKWEHVFEVASNAIMAPSSELTKLENFDTVDITTLLYLVGVHVSWIEPEPKDVYNLLADVFKSLSGVADLCVTIMNMVDKGLKRLKVLKPVIHELENPIYKGIISEAHAEMNKNKTSMYVNPASTSSQDSAEPATIRAPNSSVVPLSFIVQKKHDITVQTIDDLDRIVETQSQRLATKQKITLINVLLDTISQKLNDGFKRVGKLELNQAHKYALYKLKCNTVPRFLHEAKEIRANYGFPFKACSSEVKSQIQKLHQNIQNHRTKLDQMYENARWILLALESINHQRKIWAFPYYEINHLEQIAKYGAPKQKRNFLVKKLLPKLLRSQRTNMESICREILPFEKMFEVFLLPSSSDAGLDEKVVVQLEIEVNRSESVLLFKDIEEETKSYYTDTIFLSDNEFTLNQTFDSEDSWNWDNTSNFSNMKKNKVLYLKRRRSTSTPGSSTNVDHAQPLPMGHSSRTQAEISPLVKSSEHVFWTRLSPNRNSDRIF